MQNIKNNPYHIEDFGIYVHWPFCAAKCPYCDFNSHLRPTIKRNSGEELKFAYAIAREIEYMADYISDIPRPNVGSIFFGGGTPSLMSPHAVEIILNQIAKLCNINPNAEISLEANPTSVDAENFYGYAQNGVNRLSLGVQSLNDATLQFLGRKHSADDARNAFETASKYYPRISIDMIYAHPKQTGDAWKEELETALSLTPQHISLYQLTIEPGTLFEHYRKRGTLSIPDPDHAARLYEITTSVTAKYGFQDYEISNYAQPGQECRHNLLYWNYGDYLGVGPGAHSRLTKMENNTSIPKKRALMMYKHPEAWYRNISQKGHGVEENIPLSLKEQGEEMILMGLRLKNGISKHRWQKRCRQKWPESLAQELIDYNLLEMGEDGDHIRATQKGRLVLNALIAHLCSKQT